ncbi:MAG: hypothetical protein IKU04_03955 [Bacteroidales bacterium]|nr:hypothetical protein [Bacteroidales bacterium]MBR5073030.1 hypothetical protein [Bacteroidales bacterium]
MKYIVRAVKYFIYICVLVTIILLVLVLTHFVSSDINVMFKEGWRSVAKILVVFAGIAAIYPLFGYRKLLAGVLGELGGLRDGVVKCMEERGYRLESEDSETMTFRSRSVLNRIFRVWEDRITVTKTLGGFEVEGLSRDVARIVPALEYRFRNPDSE